MRILVRSLLAAAFPFLFPVLCYAAVSLTAADSIVGLGVTVQLSGASANQSVVLTVEPPKGAAFSLQGSTNEKGAAAIEIPGKQTQRAGTYAVTATVGGKVVGPPLTVAVLPDMIDGDMSDLQVLSPRIEADGSDTADIEVTLRDRFGNVLPGRIATLVSGRPEDVVTTLTSETDNDGVQHFRVRTTLPGTIQLRAVDLLSGLILHASATVQAIGNAVGGDKDYPTYTSQGSYGGQKFYGQLTGNGFDIIDAFEISGPAELDLGVEQTITVTAVDKDGQIVQDYVGTIILESTDPSAVLPSRGIYEFKSRDQGEKKFPLGLAFNAAGSQTLRVYDNQNRTPTGGPYGEMTFRVGGHSATPSTGNGIDVTSPRDGDVVNTASLIVEGIGPRFANLIVSGGVQNATGSSDTDGKFSIPVTLNPGMTSFTLRVQDDTKRNDSGPIRITLDASGPQIGSVTFSPERPNPGDKVLAVVQTEPDLQEVTLKLTPSGQATTGLSVTLPETTSGSGGVYQAFFTAPETGAYQPTVSAMDRAGNVSEVRSTLTVGQQTLPTVQNVKAEARVNAVGLSWDPMTMVLDGYRIYVGDAKDNFLYTLDTNRVTTKATIAGLTPGKTYFFAVTALKGQLESKDKSETVTSQVLGLTLDVTPGNGALNVKWVGMSANNSVQVGTYELAYGTDASQLNEIRTLNGQSKETTLRDLINGLTYFVTLTPITVTGDKVEELSAKGQGTPTGTGFTPGPRDDIPFDAATHPGQMLTSPPATTGSGMPLWGWLSALAMGLLGGTIVWRRRMAARTSEAFLKTIQEQYRR